MKEFVDKLKDRLEEARKIAYNTYKNYELNVDLGRAFGAENAIEIVNQLAEEYKLSEMPTGWIPCSERLPDSDTQVLITYSNGHVDIALFSDNGKFYDESGGIAIADVLAWQPWTPPAPYTKGE